MLDKISQPTSIRPRRSILALLSFSTLICVAPISLVQAQTAEIANGSAIPTQDVAPRKAMGASQDTKTRIVVFRLRYVSADEAAASLRKSFKPKEATFLVDSYSNVIAVRGNKAAFARVSAAIKKMDVSPRDQGTKSLVLDALPPNNGELATILGPDLA